MLSIVTGTGDYELQAIIATVRYEEYRHGVPVTKMMCRSRMSFHRWYDEYRHWCEPLAVMSCSLVSDDHTY